MTKKLTPFLIVILLVSMFLSTVQLPVVGAAENSWTNKEPMQIARGGLGVAVVNDLIYAIGGSNNDTQLGVTEEYNPVTDTWTTKTPLPTPRSGFAIAVYQNKIYCIGGTKGDSDNFVSGFTGVTEVYDPATDSWETKSPMATPRADLCAAVINDSIYCMGGKRYWGFDPYYRELNITEVYNPANDTWTTKADMPVPVFGCSSAVLNGKIYVIGGSRHFQLGPELSSVSSNQVYDPKNDTWSNGNHLPLPEGYGAAAATNGVTAPKRIYFVGGSNGTGIYSPVPYAYDSALDVWSAGASIPIPRVYLGLAVVDDVLYAVGGFDGENWLNVTEQYVPLGYGTVPPDIQVLSPENKTYSSNNLTLVLSVNRPTTWIGYSLDDQANVTVTGDTELKELSEGEHRITVYVNDTFGNLVSSDAVQFYVDTFAPQIAVFSPENKTYGGSDIQTVFTVDEPTSWIGYSLDGEDNVTATANVTLAALSTGSHNITFYAIDLVGNTGTSGTIYFEIAPFPTVLVVAVAVTITITTAASYLFLKRKKTITKNTKQNSNPPQ